MKLFTWKQRFTIWSTAVGSLIIFGLIGFGLDQLFGTYPIIFVILLLGSFPVALMLTIRRLQPVIQADLKRLEKEITE